MTFNVKRAVELGFYIVALGLLLSIFCLPWLGSSSALRPIRSHPLPASPAPTHHAEHNSLSADDRCTSEHFLHYPQSIIRQVHYSIHLSNPISCFST